MLRLIILVLLVVSCNGRRDTPPGNNSDSVINTKKVDTVHAKDDVKIPVLINVKDEPVKLKPVAVKLAKGDSFTLRIPKDYQLSIAAEGLKRLRFLAMAPDGRLFGTDMYDRSDNHRGRVLLFGDWNDTLKRFGQVSVFLDGLHNPNQVAFYKDFIYVAETDKLTRYRYQAGESKPSDTGQVLMHFPAYGLGYKYGGWHLTRSLAFHENKLYVSIGSSCNACIETEEIRASIIEMDPGGTNVRHFSRGLRNSVGLKWIGDELWATGMGRDLIGPDKPEDLLLRVEDSGYYGWPYYFQYHQKIYEDDQFKDSVKPSWVKKPPVAFLGFKAHSAPLGFEHLKNFDDPGLNNAILVCLHGSTSVWRERGNAIVKAGIGNSYTEVVSGFLTGKRRSAGMAGHVIF